MGNINAQKQELTVFSAAVFGVIAFFIHNFILIINCETNLTHGAGCLPQ